MIRVTMTFKLPLDILLAAIFPGPGNSSSKIVYESFSSYSRLNVSVAYEKSARALAEYFGMKFLSSEIQ